MTSKEAKMQYAVGTISTFMYEHIINTNRINRTVIIAIITVLLLIILLFMKLVFHII